MDRGFSRSSIFDDEKSQKVKMLIQYIRALLLRVIHALRRISLFLQSNASFLSWSWRKAFLDNGTTGHKTLSKLPKCPSLVYNDDSDMMTFLSYCMDREIETVALHKPAGLVVGNVEECLKDAGFRVVERTIGTNFQVFCTRHGKQVKIDVLADRHAYSLALQDRAIGTETTTHDITRLLGTPKIDMLIFTDQETVGNFPPLALRACELYFVSRPINDFQLDNVFAKFARTEQRKGT